VDGVPSHERRVGQVEDLGWGIPHVSDRLAATSKGMGNGATRERTGQWDIRGVFWSEGKMYLHIVPVNVGALERRPDLLHPNSVLVPLESPW
jgi:hypothetical protein